jgi:hypothetical protein
MFLSLGFGVAFPSFVQKKSMAAIVAACALAEDPGLARVALSQSWAYGGNLYLPRGVELLDLPFSPTVEDLERVVPGCQYVGLYRESLRTSPDLGRWLAENGYVAFESFEWGRSRAVEVFVAEE